MRIFQLEKPLLKKKSSHGEKMIHPTSKLERRLRHDLHNKWFYYTGEPPLQVERVVGRGKAE